MKESSKMSWYAVRTQNNKELSVLEKLKNEVKISNLEDKLGQVIVPSEKIFSIKNGKKIFREKVTIPGYIFVETSAKGEIANILKLINGSSGFVRTRSGEIVAMKDHEVKKILSDQEVSDNKDFSNTYVLDEMVEIIDGPFSTFKGKITQMDVEKDRLKIQVSIFGRPTSVDLTFIQIKKM